MTHITQDGTALDVYELSRYCYMKLGCAVSCKVKGGLETTTSRGKTIIYHL